MVSQKTHAAILYTRVSSMGQVEEGTSLVTQFETCQRKAAELGIPVAAAYEDAGISGGSLKLRAGMLQAMEDIRSGKADTLIIANMTRYSRDVEHQQLIKKAVRQAGGRIVFTDMQFDDTPEGDLAFNVSGAFAEYERKVFRQRSMIGNRRRAQEGMQVNRSHVPYGYHIPTKADVLRGDYPADLLGKYLVAEDQARIVRRIFDDIALGNKSLSAVARELQNEGIPTPKRAAYWMAGTVRVIVCNPVYKGEAAFGKSRRIADEDRLTVVSDHTGRACKLPYYREKCSENSWIKLNAPAIVSESTWELAQERIRQNQSIYGGNPLNIRMLSGRVCCAVCGGTMQTLSPGRKHADRAKYICGRHLRRKRDTGEQICTDARFKLIDVEKDVVDAIISACEQPEALAAALRVYREEVEAKEPDNQRLSEIDSELADLASEEQAAIQAQIAGIRSGAPAEAYAPVFADIAERRKALDAERQAVCTVAPSRRSRVRTYDYVSMDGLKSKILAHVREALTAEDIAGVEKRDIVSQVIERVVCSGNGTTVQFKAGLFSEDTLKSAKADFVHVEP